MSHWDEHQNTYHERKNNCLLLLELGSRIYDSDHLVRNVMEEVGRKSCKGRWQEKNHATKKTEKNIRAVEKGLVGPFFLGTKNTCHFTLD